MFSTDGTALTTMTVIGSPTATDGDTLWMRWVFNPNDGAGNRTLAAYQSPDGVTWTQIGATVTTAGAVTLFDNSTVGYSLGGEAAGTNAPGATIYEVQIRDGLNGPSVVPLLPDLWPPNAVSTANTVAVTGAPVLTFVNGSHPGANLAYWSDTARLDKATPPLGQKATLVSLSHNQGVSFGADFLTAYESLRTAVEARLPGAPTVVITQNPQKAASVGANQHAQRRLDLIGHARQKGLGLIDTYRAFLDYGDWATDLMSDDIHPNAAGEDLWRDTVKAALD